MKGWIIAAGIIALLVVGSLAGLFVAVHSWEESSSNIIEDMDRDASSQAPVRDAELAALPASVARYLRAVLPESLPPIRMARLDWRGDFLLKPEPRGWRPFRAREVFTSQPPGYVWDARIRSGPVTIFVRDAFVKGNGSMRAALAGAVTVTHASGTPEMAAASLERYLAEAVWFPTALLPSQGVRWTAISDTAARATLTAGPTTVSVEFHFGPDGLIHTAFVPNRYRAVGNRMVPTPWYGHLGEYRNYDGLRIPRDGWVEWMLPEGPQPYWRGQLRSASFLH